MRDAHTLGMNTNRLTLTNESITFTPRGIYIQPVLSDGFWFNGSPAELVSIMVFHTELDVENARFRVTSKGIGQ